MRQSQGFARPRPSAPAQASSDLGRYGATRPAAADSAGPSRALGALLERLVFLRGFVQHPSQIGSVVPSSRFLEAQLIRSGGLEKARCVVELGPGTGGATRAFLRVMPPSSHLLAIELNPDFHSRIGRRIRDPRLVARLGSAEQIATHLATWRLPVPDAIVSGIPFSTTSATAADRIAAAVADCLAPGGHFVAYQLRSHVARFASPYLGEPRQQWQWLNVPPVQVFVWTKPQEQAVREG